MNALSALEPSPVAQRFNIIEFISPRMFTELTSLSRFKLNELIKADRIRARRADGRILIEVASVNEYIESLPDVTSSNEAPQPQEIMPSEAKLDLFA
jgi:hypothetical protein